MASTQLMSLVDYAAHIAGYTYVSDLHYLEAVGKWWKCSEGHVWNAVIYSRTTARTGCPVCAGQVNTVKLTRYAELEAEAQLRRSVAAKD